MCKMNNQHKAMGYQHPDYDHDPSLKSSLSELSESFEKHLNPKSEIMKISELRFGNYISTWNKYSANGFNESQVEEDTFPHLKELKAKPIPITEEWLVKLGFNNGFSDQQFMIKVTKNCSMSVWMYHGNNCMIGDELELSIEYVHQLQNLYFALTGEELPLIK